MDKFLMYLLEANVLILVLALVYLVICNKMSFRWRRISLILIPLLAMGVVMVRLFDSETLMPVYNLPVYELDALALPSLDKPVEHSSIYPAYGRIYMLFTILLLVMVTYRISRLIIKFRKHSKKHSAGIYIAHFEHENCYSFLNYIQVNPSLSAEQQELIVEHEKIHILKKHSYDKIYYEIMQTINWFNPGMILLKKELTSVHEYQVDEVMYGRHDVEYMEFLLNYALGTSSTPYLLTNQFYIESMLVKRIKRMKTKTKNKWALALMIPAIATSFTLVSWNIKADKTDIIQTTSTAIAPSDSIEKMPEFNGGQEAMMKYLGENIVYPESAKKNKISGTVYVSFLVESTGKVTNCAIKKSVDADIDKEALRVVSAMPNWIPGEAGGKKVNVEMVLPISFQL